MAAASSSAEAAAAWTYHQVDGDYCYDAATLDANYNGYNEDQWYDVDNDCKWDTHLWNGAYGDNFLENVTFDIHEDTRWDVWAVDTNQRVGFDMVYFDNNGDGYSDAYVSLAGTTSTTSLMEAINRNSGIFRTNPTFMNQLQLGQFRSNFWP